MKKVILIIALVLGVTAVGFAVSNIAKSPTAYACDTPGGC